jgi:hypothetical protein
MKKSRHLWRIGAAVAQLVFLSALVVFLRCANYQEVFVAGNVYFTDADCYARMTRVRLCAEEPGRIVRHHDFENFPFGTTPHTTAPLDYLILALSLLLKPFSGYALDLAGALISPLLAVITACFLWWWTRVAGFRYRWPALILFAASPILVHGTELGRPDHQSLLLLLLTVALSAEWSLLRCPSRGWGIVRGSAWALALWVSLYEPLILLLFVIGLHLFLRRSNRLFTKTRSAGWICFVVILLVALALEQRVPSFFAFATDPFVRNWSRSIGELRPISLGDAIWFRWTGYLLLLIPFILWTQRRQLFAPAEERPAFLLLLGLLGASFLLTLWQARWAYFFVSLFVLSLPMFLEHFRARTAVWAAFVLSLLPVARAWDERFWPNDLERTGRFRDRIEMINLRQLAAGMKSPVRQGFLAPWWISPALAYWSAQPGVAGSAHEGISGIADTARFYASDEIEKARAILVNRQVGFVIGYDADRVSATSSQILGQTATEHAVCYRLDRAPSASPTFLVLAIQNPAGKLFRVANKW